MEEVTKRFIEVYNVLLKEKVITSASDFAKKLGVSGSMITEIVKGRTGVGTKVIHGVVKDFKVNGGWLFSGKGEMFVNNSESEVLSQATMNMSLNANGSDGYAFRNNSYTDNVFAISEDEVVYDVEDIEVFTNKNGNKFYIYPSGRIKIEVPKVPFPAYASYIESFQDENCNLEDFEQVTFMVDHIAKGKYMAFVSEGDSMWNEGGYDTPDGAEILAREIGRQFWDSLRTTKYGLIFVTKTGIMHKDIGGYNESTGMLTLLSRNPEHKPFEYPINDVYQVFNVIKRSF